MYSWLTLQQSAWPTVAFACCSLSILFPVEIRALWLVKWQTENQLYWMGVCLRARMCVTFVRLVLMLTNVKIVSAERSRPLIQVSFHVPYFSIISWHYLCWNIIINVAKLSVCKRSSLRSQGDVTGIVEYFALAPANLLLNTMRAHSIECIQLTDIAARPKKHHLQWLRGNYSKSKRSSLYQFWSIT